MYYLQECLSKSNPIKATEFVTLSKLYNRRDEQNREYQPVFRAGLEPINHIFFFQHFLQSRFTYLSLAIIRFLHIYFMVLSFPNIRVSRTPATCLLVHPITCLDMRLRLPSSRLYLTVGTFIDATSLCLLLTIFQ